MSPFDCRRRIARSLATLSRLSREDIEFAVLGQKLDLHLGPGLLPGLADEIAFQAAEAPLRRADQISHGRLGLAHLK